MQPSDRERTDRVGGKRDIESKYYQSIITKRHMHSSWLTQVLYLRFYKQH